MRPARRLFQLAKRLGVPAALAQRLAKRQSCSGIVRAKFDATLRQDTASAACPRPSAPLLAELFLE